MREPRAVQVALVIDEYLGLVDEATKCGRMNDPVAVALVFTPVGRARFVVLPAAAVGLARRVRRQVGVDGRRGSASARTASSADSS